MATFVLVHGAWHGGWCYRDTAAALRPAEAFNVTPARRAWVDRRCVPQALATFEMPVLLTGAGAQVAQRVYVLADGWDPSPFRWFATRLDNTPGWRVKRFPCGHDVMVDMPVELAQELMHLA